MIVFRVEIRSSYLLNDQKLGLTYGHHSVLSALISGAGVLGGAFLLPCRAGMQVCLKPCQPPESAPKKELETINHSIGWIATDQIIIC
jgi:hypothetical protein